MKIIPEEDKSYPNEDSGSYIKSVQFNPVSNLDVEECTQINELN